MTKVQLLQEYIENHPGDLGQVVDFNPSSDRLLHLDLTENNRELGEAITDISKFENWINLQLINDKALYGIGGYQENRSIYTHQNLFNTDDEPRSLHLGTDIWGKAGTKIYAPLDAQVHSFAYNSAAGDYGATIILEHNLPRLKLFTLYGHLSLKSIAGLKKQQDITRNQAFASLGIPEENGNWPPHLHFQLILDIGDYDGDYPGVCRYSERKIWLANSPDPAHLLNFTFYKL